MNAGRLCLALVVLTSCKPVDVVLLEPTDAGPPSIEGLRALRIDPPAPEVLVDHGDDGHAEQQFRAWGTFDDGERDITSAVEWRIGRPRLGRIDRGLFETVGIGGSTFVEARSGAIVAAASIEILVEVIVDRRPTAGVFLPIGEENDRGGPDAPQLIYPADGVVVPANIGALDPMWLHHPTHDVFELRIESNVARVRIITDTDRETIALANELAWILESHAGRTFRVFVRSAVSSAPDEVYRSNVVTVRMVSSTIDGTGYFWSTAPPAVLRTTFSTDTPEQRYPPRDELTRCTGCHVISRDGRRMATTRGDDRLTLFDLERGESIRGSNERDFEWGAFGPGGNRLVYVDEGRLRVMDVRTDQNLPDVPLPQGSYGAHPDWSPDGRFIVIAYSTTEKPEAYEIRETSIARIDIGDDGTYSTPTILVAAQGETALMYPAISWDGRFIAYTRSPDERGRNATLELVAANGGAPTILTVLNERVGIDTGVDRIHNVMPGWLPDADPAIEWITFSSRRAYGHRLSANTRAQIWVSAFDPALSALGRDPTAPAFWVSFQPLQASNYRLLFSTGQSDNCASIVEVCNGMDDNCDGTADENCCSLGNPETCGNLVDDDCNGLVDDQCSCDGPEICDNGLDDNCDREIDRDDEACP